MGDLEAVLEKVYRQEVLTREDGVALLNSGDLSRVGRAADHVRRLKHPDGVVSFLLDRNINYTNVCVARCAFCNFSRRPRDPEGYVLSREELFAKIDETIALGGTGILLQGGMNPDLRIDFFEELLRALKGRYAIHLHCFSPPEIVTLARLSKLDVRTTIRRLQAAGLDSIPGGGAEILVDRLRRANSPGKCSAWQWLEVMRIAHEEGMRTTATMVIGMGESVEEQVEHLDSLRRLQEDTGGFAAFIPWTAQLEGVCLESSAAKEISPVEYLMLLAVSRLYLHNFQNIQVSWLTQGLKVAQIALHFGANDVGSVMIEENVIRSAGARYTATRDDLLRLIREAGFVPAQRDTLYRTFKRFE
jgi:cyclic dehypoxanthinyl futalosine synthase